MEEFERAVYPGLSGATKQNDKSPHNTTRLYKNPCDSVDRRDSIGYNTMFTASSG